MKTEDMLIYYKGVEALKRLVRKGWTLRGIPNPESVADHIFGVSSLAIYFGKERNLNMETLLITSIIHEACEIELGDITPYDGFSKEEKQKLETESATKFLLEVDSTGKLAELWKDFEYERTEEGRLVKDIDRLEMLLQAFMYENKLPKSLDEFYLYAEKTVNDPEMKTIVQEIMKMQELRIGRAIRPE